METPDSLEICSIAIDRALQFPTRHSEYKGDILADLGRIRKRIEADRLSPRDAKILNEISLLTEKWVEA